MTTSPTGCDPQLFPLIESLCAQRLGASNLAGAALADAVRKVSESYLRKGASPLQLRSDPVALCARLKFFLPRDLPKIKAPLAELASVAALPSRSHLRVLDLGAGLGTTSLGAADFLLALPGVEQLEIDALDADPRALALGAELCERWARARGHSLRVTPHVATLTPLSLARLRPPYDLITLGFVLNELADELVADHGDPVQHHVELLLRACELLADDGVLIVLEPALRPTSRRLQEVRERLRSRPGAPHVFAPCLHRAACPLLARERDWCHAQLPLQLAEPLAAIARGAGLRAEGPSFSYLTLHAAPRSLAELDPSATLYRLVSGALPSKGKLEFMLCAQTGPVRLRRLDRNASAQNSALDSAHRGCVMRVEPAAAVDATRLDVGADCRITLLSTASTNAPNQAPSC